MSLDPGEPQRKLRGSFPGAKTRPTRTLAAGDRSARSRSSPRPATRPATSPSSTRRDRTLLCGDAFTTLGGVATTDKVRPAASRWPAWPPGTGRPSSRAPARCARWTRRGWRPATARSSRRPPPRWTRRSPRRRLADAARRAGHRPRGRRRGRDRRRRGPGRGHPRAGGRRARRARRLALQPRRRPRRPAARGGPARRARARPPRCATPRSADRAPTPSPPRPRLPPLRERASGPLRGQRGRAGARRRRASGGRAGAVDVVIAVLRGWRLEADDAVHAARAFRSAVHGFVLLEASGGFGIPSTSTPPSTASSRRWPAAWLQVDDLQVTPPAARSASATTRRWQ